MATVIPTKHCVWLVEEHVKYCLFTLKRYQTISLCFLHITMVTMLQDLNPGEVFAPGAIFLSVVTYVGTAVSILCLLITVVTYSASK